MIVAILAAIALPAYQTYTARSKFTEVVSATGPVKTQMELCLLDVASSAVNANCTNGKSGNGWKIDTNTNYASTYTKQIDASAVNSTSLTVTATANSTGGLNGETYVLTGTIGT